MPARPANPLLNLLSRVANPVLLHIIEVQQAQLKLYKARFPKIRATSTGSFKINGINSSHFRATSTTPVTDGSNVPVESLLTNTSAAGTCSGRICFFETLSGNTPFATLIAAARFF